MVFHLLPSFTVRFPILENIGCVKTPPIVLVFSDLGKGISSSTSIIVASPLSWMISTATSLASSIHRFFEGGEMLQFFKALRSLNVLGCPSGILNIERIAPITASTSCSFTEPPPLQVIQSVQLF